MTLNLTKDSGTATLTVARDSEGIESGRNLCQRLQQAGVPGEIADCLRFIHQHRQHPFRGRDDLPRHDPDTLHPGDRPDHPDGGIYTTLSEVGISIQSDGSMSVNSAKLQTAIDNNFTDLKDVLGGYGKAVADAVDDLTDNNGAVTTRVASLTSSPSRSCSPPRTYRTA